MISLSKGHILLITNDRDWLEKLYHSFSFHKHIRYVDVDQLHSYSDQTGWAFIRCALGSKNGCWQNFKRAGNKVCAVLVCKRGQHRCSHLLSINIAGRYGNHCRLPYETSQKGPNPKRGPVNPETQRKGKVFKLFSSRILLQSQSGSESSYCLVFSHIKNIKNKERRKPEFQADLCDPDSVLWSDDLPHIRQHNQTSDEDNDAENRAGGQHKGLFQGHEPSS